MGARTKERRASGGGTRNTAGDGLTVEVLHDLLHDMIGQLRQDMQQYIQEQIQHQADKLKSELASEVKTLKLSVLTLMDKIDAMAVVAPPGGRTTSNDADEIQQSQASRLRRRSPSRVSSPGVSSPSSVPD